MNAADGASGNPVIVLGDVRCIAEERTLLHIDALTIRAGERVALIGRNGAGKSTLLRLLTGFRAPSRGSIEVLGHRLDRGLRARELRRLRRDVGQVMQGLHLVGRLSAFDNVALGALGRLAGTRAIAGSWARWWTADVARAARDGLAAAGLSAMADVPVDRLSGGERQKVALARMWMQRPRLILVDEPTANLDPQTALRFANSLRDGADAATVVGVVHDTDLMAHFATRVVGLRDGRIVVDRPIDAIAPRDLDRIYR